MIYVGEQGNTIYGGSTITEEQKNRMVAVEALPEPEDIEGKVAQIKANLETQEVYYVYEYYVPSQEDLQKEELAHLKQEDLNNKEAIAELYMMTMGGI